MNCTVRSALTLCVVGAAIASLTLSPTTASAGSLPTPAWPLYVGDRSTQSNVGTTGSVGVYNSSGTLTNTLNDSANPGNSLGSAEGMAISGNNLYAAGQGQIDVVNKTTGAPLTPITTTYSNVIGLTIANGSIYATEYDATTNEYYLQRFNLTTGASQAIVPIASGLGNAFGVAATASGQLLVTLGNSAGGDSVVSYSPDLSSSTTLVSGAGTYRFAGITVDPFNGNFFVSDVSDSFSGPGSILEYNSSGHLIGSETLPNDGSWFTAVGPDGNLYAAVIGNDTVEKITLTNGVIDSTSPVSTFIANAGSYSKSLVFDVAPSSVPEPGGLALLATGIIGSVGYGIRRRKKFAG